jgi:hypothetical protein
MQALADVGLAPAMFNVAVLLGERGDSEGAIVVYDDVVARFGDAPDPALRVAALHRSSREIVEGERPIDRAISRMPRPRARRIAISSRSAKDR